MKDHGSPLRQLGIYEPLCPACAGWEFCGGSDSAPCRCVRREKDKKRQCKGCWLICRERPNDSFGDFNYHLGTGLPLHRVSVLQPPGLKLPVLIPLRTQEIKEVELVPFDWIGIDAKILFSYHRGKAATLKKHFKTALSTRRFLRVKEDADLIAILNGKDDVLEGFWAMHRGELFEKLREIGVSGATGPTFSIAERGIPESHNICMLLRHHKVIRELGNIGLIAIPNIYWRKPADRQDWVHWLRGSEIHLVSRDFSRTRNRNVFLEELESLVDILGAVERSFHVILVGVGPQNASRAIPFLTSRNHSCSVATSYPILLAMKGGCGLKFNRQTHRLDREKHSSRTRVDLARSNLLEMMNYLSWLEDFGNCPSEHNTPATSGVQERPLQSSNLAKAPQFSEVPLTSV